MPSIGSVSSLWRYPVKSMLGELCDALRFDGRGVEGDRLFAVRDAAGKFGSGKDTRRFRKINRLLEFRASYCDKSLHIEFPEGGVWHGQSPALNGALSQALGQAVTLVSEAAVSHLDAGAVHLVTSASLRWLRKGVPGASCDETRFRPNLVLDWEGAGPIEQAWTGKQLQLGKDVRLQLDAPTERCGMVALAQGNFAHEPDILRYIAQFGGLKFGVYAVVSQFEM